MKKRIFRSLCLTVLVTLLLNTGLSSFFFFHFYENREAAGLANESQALAQALTTSEDPISTVVNFAEKNSENLRITFIDAEGKVLYDNRAQAPEMENHADRPEVQRAKEFGSGTDERLSDTLGKVTLYSAVAVPNSGDVIRLARDRDTFLGIFLRFMPLTVVMALLLFLLSLATSSRITRWLLAPVEEAGDQLASGKDPQGYDELAPFFATIHAQQQTINAQMANISHERDTITMILENMAEGMVLLDARHHVMAVNQSAMKFFNPYVMPRVGEHMLALSRNPDLLEAVEEAETGESSSGIIENGPFIGRYFVNPVLKDGAVNGTIILLLNITAERSAQMVKEEFSANVSHELRTPLTSISGFAEMLRDGMVHSPEDTRAFARHIYDEAQRLLLLIDDIMLLSSLESGTDNFTESVDLHELADDVLARHRHLAAEKNVSLALNDHHATVIGNATLLSHVITNLVDNAIKYNVEGGRVQVIVQEDDEHVILSVSDTGIGIPEEAQAHVFQRFYRVDKSHSKETGGTGLGLSIVKHIVRRHQGELRLNSATGEGTTISVIFKKFVE